MSYLFRDLIKFCDLKIQVFAYMTYGYIKSTKHLFDTLVRYSMFSFACVTNDYQVGYMPRSDPYSLKCGQFLKNLFIQYNPIYGIKTRTWE